MTSRQLDRDLYRRIAEHIRPSITHHQHCQQSTLNAAAAWHHSLTETQTANQSDPKKNPIRGASLAIPPNMTWNALPNSKASAYTGRCKKSVLWPSKYAKMCFRPGLHPGPQWGDQDTNQTPQLAWDGGTLPVPHSTSIISLLTLATRHIAPKYFCPEWPPYLVLWAGNVNNYWYRMYSQWTDPQYPIAVFHCITLPSHWRRLIVDHLARSD